MASPRGSSNQTYTAVNIQEDGAEHSIADLAPLEAVPSSNQATLNAPQKWLGLVNEYIHGTSMACCFHDAGIPTEYKSFKTTLFLTTVLPETERLASHIFNGRPLNYSAHRLLAKAGLALAVEGGLALFPLQTSTGYEGFLRHSLAGFSLHFLGDVGAYIVLRTQYQGEPPADSHRMPATHGRRFIRPLLDVASTGMVVSALLMGMKHYGLNLDNRNEAALIIFPAHFMVQAIHHLATIPHPFLNVIPPYIQHNELETYERANNRESAVDASADMEARQIAQAEEELEGKSEETEPFYIRGRVYLREYTKKAAGFLIGAGLGTGALKFLAGNEKLSLNGSPLQLWQTLTLGLLTADTAYMIGKNYWHRRFDNSRYVVEPGRLPSDEPLHTETERPSAASRL